MLFSAAVLFFYSVSDKTPTMFGYSLFLIKDDITNKTSLVFVDKTAKVTPNSDFLFISEKNNGSRICKISEAAGEMITFSFFDDDNVEYTSSVSIHSNEYGGIVRSSNRFLGKLFEPFSQRINMPFIYMLIGGICALIILLLILLYFFFQKKETHDEDNILSEDTQLSKDTIKPEEAEDLQETEVTKEDEPSVDTNISEPSLLDIPPNQIPPPFMTDNLIEKETDSTPSTPLSPSSSKAIYVNDTVAPKEPLVEEEYVPSIESLLAEIDLLGEDLAEDFNDNSNK